MSPKIGWLIAAVMAVGGLLAASYLLVRPAPLPAPQEVAVPNLPPIAESRYQNTERGVGYIGTERCAVCHPAAHQSYLDTAHARALGDVNLETEPPDGEFNDARWQRHYRIYRKAGQLRHEETIKGGSAGPLVLADLPMKYVIGSGRFSRSYLVEREGFLYESPVTWYAAKSQWGLSPGYETFNSGFQRPVEMRCLTCHAGHIESVDNSPQKVAFHSLAIDCERCHGPGERHARRWQNSKPDTSAKNLLDPTIVNPARLNRQRREDICAQCHFHSAATVELRGRQLQDFRPGQRLSDYVVHFGFEGAEQQMEVVGHTEQMRLSRCWKESDRLTCTTCHDPHHTPARAEARDYYRSACLSCHKVESCKLPRERRILQDSTDNCVTCHMPSTPTEIPHFAFTHHRIGIHSGRVPHSESVGPAQLVPLVVKGEAFLDSPDGKFAFDQDRNLGLGYLQLSDGPGQEKFAETHRREALAILEAIADQVQGDSDLDAALARLMFRKDPEKALASARRVIESPRPTPEASATACYVLGATLYDLQRGGEARPWLERTLTLRPTADVWIMLAECLHDAGQIPAAVEAARRGSEMAPDRPRYLEMYLDLLKESGETQQARAAESRIPALRSYRARVDSANLPRSE